MTCLSMPAALASTPLPTYRTSASSSSPCRVPSSPNGPWSSGNTTSTSPSARGTWPGSSTVRDRSPVSRGTITVGPSSSATSGSRPSVSSHRAGSAPVSTHRPDGVMPIGTMS